MSVVFQETPSDLGGGRGSGSDLCLSKFSIVYCMDKSSGHDFLFRTDLILKSCLLLT